MPQNQKTDAAPLLADLPELSHEEQALVEALGEGLDNCAAYRKAYGAEGYSPAALRVRACRKVAEPDIQAHLTALRSVGFANAKLTLEARLADELAFAQRAERAGNFGAAGGAYDRINKLAGLYVEKFQEVTDPLDALKELQSIDPEYAARLAASKGMNIH